MKKVAIYAPKMSTYLFWINSYRNELKIVQYNQKKTLFLINLHCLYLTTSLFFKTILHDKIEQDICPI